MINRRQSIQKVFSGIGAAAFGSSVLPQLSQAASALTSYAGGPKRVVFFMQNNGFDPKSCIPTNVANDGSLASAILPKQIEALDPYKEKLHIINGLHGKHTSATHSAFFGALGGYRASNGMPPSASTIDYELSKILPETLLPHLCIGMDALENMTTKPTVANLSASGAGQTIPMYSNPNHLYQLLYGSISSGDVRSQYEANSATLELVESLAVSKARGLSVSEKERYSKFTRGLGDINNLRGKLENASDQLAQFAPRIDERYKNPEFETDWHDTLLDLGISALKSGTTSVLTVGSGRGDIFGSWKGLGVAVEGHKLGHMPQAGNPIWDSIRQYNMSMLIKIMEELESVPEGSGTMMDNTLIVYTSNNADKQHTNAATWPVMLLGNCGGAFKTGRFTQLDGTRPINALYTSILKTVGGNKERFNMSEAMAAHYDSGTGPLKEIIA